MTCCKYRFQDKEFLVADNVCPNLICPQNVRKINTHFQENLYRRVYLLMADTKILYSSLSVRVIYRSTDVRIYVRDAGFF